MKIKNEIMLKTTSLKIALIVFFSCFTLFDASAYKAWFRLQVEAKCKDMNGNIRNDIGFVAVKFSTQPTVATKRADLAQLHSGTEYWFGSGAASFKATAYVLAKGEGNYQFDHWELEDGTTLPNSDQEKGTASHTYYSTNRCPGNSSSGTHEHAEFHTEHTYYAVFREVVTQVVFAEAQPETLGEVKYLKENAIGDEITLRTYTKHYHNKFLGWVKQGDEDNIITTDRVLTFIISDETKGTYIALYDDEYNFVRFKNYGTGRYMDFTSDEGSLEDLASLELKSSLNDVICEAGSIIEIAEGDVKSSSGTSYRHYFDFYMQNAKTSKFYDFDINDPNAVTYGVFLRMPHDVDTNIDTWALSTDDNQLSGYRIKDENGLPKVVMGKRNEADWYIEPMDKDLETKENYFSLDPDKLVEVGGKYYTTLRTSWNILFNPEQMTPYIVSRVDETAGTFEMKPLTGNIIPAGTPVVIETKSNDIEENRMVPTLTAAASGAVPSENKLISSTKYFPNQEAPANNCKALTVINGKLVFGGDALSKVNGNEAYLSVANEVALPPKVTLAELLASGDTQNTYIVTDLTAVRLVDNDQLLFAKDNNGYPEDNKDENTGSDADYMQYASGLQHPMGLRAYDQSNWIALRVPAGDNISASVLGKHLTGVKGRLLSTVNPEFQLDVAPVSDDATAANVTPNTFVAASFQGSQDGFFFVQPKPMEIAYVEWAQWNGTKFIAPVHDENHPDWNQAELTGEFELNGAYLESPNGGSLDMSTLVSGHVYAMEPAVIKVKTSDYPHVYVLGNVNSMNAGDWSPNKGVEMSTNDGVTYTAIVTVQDATNDDFNGYGYFSFSKKLGSWDDIASYRFGSEASGSYWDVIDSHYNTALNLRYWAGNTGSFRVPTGTYNLTVTLQDGENYYAGNVVIRTVPAQAPRREAASKQYVVYPLSMTKVTSDDNGVVTGVTTVGSDRVAVGTQYINLAGVRSSQPWSGVNIVVTTYSDGTTTATKQLH